MEYTVHSHDVVIIGGGLTGLRAAVEIANAGGDVALLSKVHPLRSHSGAAQGGINAALGNAEGGEAAKLAEEALEKRVPVSDLAVEKGLITREEAGQIFDDGDISRGLYD